MSWCPNCRDCRSSSGENNPCGVVWFFVGSGRGGSTVGGSHRYLDCLTPSTIHVSFSIRWPARLNSRIRTFQHAIRKSRSSGRPIHSGEPLRSSSRIRSACVFPCFTQTQPPQVPAPVHSLVSAPAVGILACPRAGERIFRLVAAIPHYHKSVKARRFL